ncbi:MAG TPA: autotransporter-associated beta strand repeat-containing protein, partial [Verrucomicrobiae bacterium]
MKTQKSPKLGRLLHLDEHVFVTASILFCAPLVLLAGNDTWTGAGADANWNTAGNWTGANTPPVAGDSLFFDGVLNTAAVNNIAANTAFSAVTFNATAGAFTLSGNAINLNGGITNNAGFAQTISLPMALQATESINTGSGLSGQLTLSGIISGASFGLTESGGGLLALSGVNTFTGPVTVNGGTLSVAADTGLGAVPVSATPGSVVLNGGSLRTSAGITLSANRGIALGAAAGGSGTIDTGNATTSVASIYNGILANNGGVDGFIKTGLGTLTLGGANTFTGGVIINQGTLKLDFTQSGAPTANIINPANSLVMGGLSTSLGNATAPMNTAVAPGATLNVTGNSTAARSQTFNGLTLSNGLAYVTTAQTSGKTVLLALGGITNFVGAVDFTLGGTFSSGVNAITTTTPNDLSGILGGEAVYGTTAGQPSAYATVDGSGNIIAYTGYSNITANAAGIISNPTNNVRINAAAVATTSLAGSPTTANINTLTLNANVNSTVNLAAGDTLRLGTNGGLMVTYGNWGLTIGQTMGQGTLTAGGGAANTAGILNFLLDSQNGGLTINSVVADNGTGAVGLNIANTQKGNNPSGGAYGVVLNAANTFSGGTIIAAGQGNAENPSAFGTGPVTVLNGGQAYLGTNGNYANAFNIAGSGTSYNGGAAALHLNSGGAVVSGNITLLNDATIGVGTTAGGIISGPISGNYNLPLGDGAGWFSLTGANT